MSTAIATNNSRKIFTQVTLHCISKLLYVTAILLVLSACTGANANRTDAFENIIPLSTASVIPESLPTATLVEPTATSVSATQTVVFSQSSRVGMLP